MKKLQNNDQTLVDFIRQHRPDLPPLNEALETKIMAEVEETHSWEPINNSPVIPFRRRKLWLMPPAIAAGLLIVWGSNNLLTPQPPTATELASLERFLENTWDGVLEEDSQDLFLEFSPAD